MYLEFFDFNKAPFELTPDSEFIYYSDIHNDIFETVKYGIENRKGFIIISGLVGSGKTTILRLLLNEFNKPDSKTKTAYIFNPSLSFFELLSAILNDFGVRYRKTNATKVYLLEKLNDFLIKKHLKGINAAVIIDEAQLLDIKTLEEIRLLTNLETNKQKLLQIVLCGQPELDDKISSPRLIQLKQRINYYCKMYPFNYKEMNEYIIHRMRVAGRLEHLDMTDVAKRKIFSYSNGVPRLINSVCDKALLASYALNKKTVDYESVLEGIKVVEGKLSSFEKFKDFFKIILKDFFVKYGLIILIFLFLFLVVYKYRKKYIILYFRRYINEFNKKSVR